MTPQPIRDTNSPLNIFSSTNNNLFAQSQPQLIPTRVPTPIPISTIAQSPVSLKKLNLNPTNKKNKTIDLLDFGDPNPPPPPESPKFDPYA
jgi:hypothetical protein